MAGGTGSSAGTSRRIPFGKSAGKFNPLRGWVNPKTNQWPTTDSQVGRDVVVPLSWFGGSQKLVAGEARPYFKRMSDDEAGVLFDQFEEANKPFMFLDASANERYVVFSGAQPIEQQLFFAQRILPDKTSRENFIAAATAVITSAEVFMALVDRKEVEHTRQLALNFLEAKSKEPYVLPSEPNDQIIVTATSLDWIFNDLVEDFGLSRFEVHMLMRGFVSNYSRADLVEGLKHTFPFIHHDGVNLDEMVKVFVETKELIDHDLDSDIAERLGWAIGATHAYEIDYSLVRKIEDLVSELTDEARQEFEATMLESLRDNIYNPPQKRYHDRERYGLVIGLRIARGKVGILPQSIDALSKILSARDLAFSLYSTESPQAAIDAAVHAKAGFASEASDARHSFTDFVLGKKDWIKGRGTGHKAERAEFAAQYLIALADRFEAQRLNENLRYGESSASSNGQGSPRHFVSSPDSKSGISRVISLYGDSLGSDRKTHREVINYLFENGTLDDQIALANAGALSKKMAARVYEVQGVQKFGKDNAEILSQAADLVVSGIDIAQDPSHPWAVDFDQQGVLEHLRGLASLRGKNAPKPTPIAKSAPPLSF